MASAVDASPQAALPAPLTSLVGRDDDVTVVAQLLGATRLLTLTGAGGSGKTRLAIEVARRAAGAHRDGAAWVDLAALSDPDLLATHVGTALHLELGARPALDSLLDGVQGRELLLVLDNCEHLVDACAGLVELLLARASGLRILATSREALGAPGERAWLVPTLAVPDTPASATPDQVLASPAGRLFVERAEAAHATFRLTAENAPAIAAICRRLDGLPLAIELAAARVRALTPSQIAARLDTAFHVLTSAPRATVSRHRTLGEAIDWSYTLLDEGDRVVLQRLSVFSGDFSLEAAEAVCAPTPQDAVEILDRLVTLVDKSLVVMVEGDGTARYRLLETIRQYAATRLDAGGDADAVRARHARHYLALVLDAEPHFITGTWRRWVDLVMREIDHLRSALTWTRTHAPAQCVQLTGSLCWLWYSSGLWFEGRRWIETALALPAATPGTPARASVLFAGGVLAGLQGQPDIAKPWLEEAATIFAAVGDRHHEAYCLAYLGVTIGQSGDMAAVAPAERALATFKSLGDLYGQRLALLILLTMRLKAGDLVGARALGEEAVHAARLFGAARELGISLQMLGTVVFHQGHVAQAGVLLREALDALQHDPQAMWSARALDLRAMVAVSLGDHVTAAQLFAAAESQRALIGASQFVLDRQRLAPYIDQARQALGQPTFDTFWESGRALSVSDAIDLAHLADDAQAGSRPTIEAGGVAHDGDSSAHRVTAVASDHVHAAHVSTSNGASDAPPPVLSVAALGTLEITRDGVAPAAEVWRYSRARELLLYLMSHPEGRTREQLGLVFWPEATQAQVKNSFHVLLHHLRRALGRADLVTFERNRYRINWELGVRFDALDFERAATDALRAVQRDDADDAAAARLREALAIYRGDFLADESMGDWYLEWRDALQRLYADALLALGRRAQRAGQAAEAAQWYRKVVRADPLNEGGHRRLMRALARAGERGEALQHFERLTTLLKRELGAAPETKTLELVEALRRGEDV